MFDKIAVRRIVLDHFKTLRNYHTGNLRPVDFLLFFGLPFALAVALILLDVALSSSLANVLVTALSIFAGLLFNLLLLVHDLIQKSDDDSEKLRRRYLREIHTNISFGVLVSVFSVILLLFSFITSVGTPLHLVLSFLVFFLVLVFLLTLFMILTRIYTLFDSEFGRGV